MTRVSRVSFPGDSTEYNAIVVWLAYLEYKVRF